MHYAYVTDRTCTLYNTPESCNCCNPFYVDHAMICHMEGIPTIRHNVIRDITATLLIEKNCQNVATEPAVQQLDSETLVLPIATLMLGLIFAQEVSRIEVKRLKTHFFT